MAALAGALLALGPGSRAIEAQAAAPRVLQGQVTKPGADSVVPVQGVWVVLHRVGTDTAGALDSMRTDVEGRFRFRYRPTGVENATYFVTSSYHGIAYFAAPATGGNQLAEITVFDTASRGVPIRVRGRHIAVSEPAQGRRTVIEVYEISNDTTITLVEGPAGSPTFSVLLPEDATGLQMGEGDVQPGATKVEKGQLLVFAPIAPGLKQLSFSYSLDEKSFPLSVPISAGTEVLELLMEENGAQVRGAGLRALGPVRADDRQFERYLAQDVEQGAVVRIEVPGSPDAPRRWGVYVTVLTSLLAVAMLVSLAIIVMRSRGHWRVRGRPGMDEASRLAREIALLEATPSELGGANAQRIAELRAQLERALAAKSGRA
jgi:hypothetical protein